jgi:hypothetical protein
MPASHVHAQLTATPTLRRRFGNVIDYFAIVIARFGNVITHFGKPFTIDHVRPK